MMAAVGPFLWKLATSRAGIVVIIFAALFAWHKMDKSSAVRNAVVGYIASVELEAAKTRNATLLVRAERAEAATLLLQQAVADAELEQRNVEAEFEAFRANTTLDGGPLVTRELLDILRANRAAGDRRGPGAR